MFYVIECEVSYLEVTSIDFRKSRECPECGTRPLERAGGIAVVMTRKSEAVPIIEPFDRLALSDYAIKVFQDAGITGWEPLPEKMRILRRGGAKSAKIPIYHEIIVTGRAGHISQLPTVVLTKVCKKCGTEDYSDPKGGISLKESLWDGSDVFEVEGFSEYLASEKLAEVIRAKKIRGVELTPAEEWQATVRL
jgi:hypothetical protein